MRALHLDSARGWRLHCGPSLSGTCAPPRQGGQIIGCPLLFAAGSCTNTLGRLISLVPTRQVPCTQCPWWSPPCSPPTLSGTWTHVNLRRPGKLLCCSPQAPPSFCCQQPIRCGCTESPRRRSTPEIEIKLCGNAVLLVRCLLPYLSVGQLWLSMRNTGASV